MSPDNDERLLSVLALIENDIETLALSMLALAPPLIHLSLPQSMQQEADHLAEILIGLGEAHRGHAVDIHTKLREKLSHV